jgi:plasmid stability protein
MTVRNLPEDVQRRIRLYAAEHGLSAEAAARRLLDEATRPAERLGDVVTAFARARPISRRFRVTTRPSRPPISRDRPRHQRDLGTHAQPP